MEVEEKETAINHNNFGVFNENAIFFCSQKIFFYYYHALGSVLSLTDLNPRLVVGYIETTLKDKIKIKHERQFLNRRKKMFQSRNTIYVMKNGIVIDVTYDFINLVFKSDVASEARDFGKMLVKNYSKKKERQKSYISIMANNGADFRLIDIENKKVKLDLDLDYNDDVKLFYNRTINFLKRKGSGLLIITGPPGVGKTSLLGYIIQKIKMKTILIPPSVFGYLDSPTAVTFILDNAYNATILIEDAEFLLRDRCLGNSAMSTLLNLSDGLLGHSLNLKIICSCNNQDKSLIDPAALRIGRCVEIFSLQPLSIEKSQNMLKRLGVTNFVPNTPMSLAEIYGKIKNSYEFNNSNRKQIGFRNGI